MRKQRKLSYARFREEGQSTIPTTVLTEVKTTVAGTKTQTFLANVFGNGEYACMSDVVTPGFNPKDGRIIMSPMSLRRYHQYGSGTGYLILQKNNGDTFEGNGHWIKYFQSYIGCAARLLPHPILETNWGNARCQMAITEAATKASRLPGDANVLVTLAELRKTRDMLPNLLTSWSQFFRRLTTERAWGDVLRRKGIGRGTPFSVDLADQVNTTYLMARFGLRPLIMETEGVLKAITRQLGVVRVERNTARAEVAYTEQSNSSLTGAVGILRVPLNVTSTHEVKIRAMQIWEAEVDAIRDIGLTIESIPEAAIDLVKYSFLVNWMVNINDYASALAAQGSSPWRSKGACMVAERKCSSTMLATGGAWLTNTTSYTLLQEPTGVATATTVSKTRSMGLPEIGLTVRARPLRWMEDARLVDAIGLLRNALRPHQASLNQLALLRANQLRSL